MIVHSFHNVSRILLYTQPVSLLGQSFTIAWGACLQFTLSLRAVGTSSKVRGGGQTYKTAKKA